MTEPHDLILEHLKKLREGQQDSDKRLDVMTTEIRSLNQSMKGILTLLGSQQEVDNLHSLRMDDLEFRVKKLEQSIENRTEH